ncbi:beta-lactamase family protein [Flavobacteriaceae bacterium TP-CH-4]|uniref:Beta-lactamase family protein n=1 Tax=Pelagihabitans pacificus TaxID=2696054 RepID=A0A967AT01_9FLAO|nr:serine hydrolase domain-containing protein [Pelagihabitans pacificus]NHF58408.1 beta-lactamase family protein [Pelagihabitans pacificus]
MMRLWWIVGLLFLGCRTEPDRTRETNTRNSIEFKKVDAYMATIAERYGIPGATLAIVKNGKVIHKNHFGHANLEHQVPVSDSTIFRLYSLTKPFTAVSAFQLVEEGILSLEDPVSKYIGGLPASWNDIQIKHLLTHSSGLPDMAPYYEFQDLTETEAKAKVFGQKLRFNKGEKYDYNQTGFWMLQQIIEKASGINIEEFVGKHQFNGAPMNKDVLFSSDSRDIVQNRATPYFFFSKGKLTADLSYLQGRYLLSANGLNMDVQRFVKWDKAMGNDILIKAETKRKMWSLFDYAHSDKQFTYGWDYHGVNGHASYGFSGSFVTAYRTFPSNGLSIILLSNGLGSWYNIENAINHIAGLVDRDLRIEDNFIFESLLEKSLKSDFDTFKVYYQELIADKKYLKVNFERLLNSIGYMLLNLKENNKALDIFKLNTQEHPTSWNVWDSLGEGYERSFDTINATKFYQKSVELNPENTHGLEKLKMLNE